MDSDRTKFEALLLHAKNGDKNAQEEIFRMYRPLLTKNAMDRNLFDEDLYQELSATLITCIHTFRIQQDGETCRGLLCSPLRIKQYERSVSGWQQRSLIM